LRQTKSQTKGKGFLATLREFLYGVAVHEHVSMALREKTSMEHTFMLVSFGDTLGVPLVRSYYSLRLFPYVFPGIHSWKRTLLRERDWSDWSFD